MNHYKTINFTVFFGVSLYKFRYIIIDKIIYLCPNKKEVLRGSNIRSMTGNLWISASI